jgi:hypothetical protein
VNITVSDVDGKKYMIHESDAQTQVSSDAKCSAPPHIPLPPSISRSNFKTSAYFFCYKTEAKRNISVLTLNCAEI